jgi:hypothetical protein
MALGQAGLSSCGSAAICGHRLAMAGDYSRHPNALTSVFLDSSRDPFNMVAGFLHICVVSSKRRGLAEGSEEPVGEDLGRKT